MLVAGWLLLAASAAFAQSSPSISVDPSTVRPGGTVTVTGRGFAPLSTIRLSLVGFTLGVATADSSGRFTGPISMPRGSRPGTWLLVATDASRRSPTVSTPLTVESDAPRPTLRPSSVTFATIDTPPPPTTELPTSPPTTGQIETNLSSDGSEGVGIWAILVGVLGLGTGAWLARRSLASQSRRSRAFGK